MPNGPVNAACHARKSSKDGPTFFSTPIFQVHGLRDGVIPIARAAYGRDALKALGYDVEWHEYPMEHSVCMEEIADLNRFLLRVLA